MLPVIRTTNHIARSSGTVSPYWTISQNTAAGTAKMMRNSTAQRFKRTRGGQDGTGRIVLVVERERRVTVGQQEQVGADPGVPAHHAADETVRPVGQAAREQRGEPPDHHDDEQGDEEEVQDDDLRDGQDDAEAHREPPCGAVPAYHMSTRRVGIAIAASVMETPYVWRPRAAVRGGTLEHRPLSGAVRCIVSGRARPVREASTWRVPPANAVPGTTTRRRARR